MPMVYTSTQGNGIDPARGADTTKQGLALYPNGVLYNAMFLAGEYASTATTALSLIPSLINPANDKTFNNPTATTAALTTLLSLPWNQQPLGYLGATPRIWGSEIIPGNNSSSSQVQGNNGGFQLGSLYRIKTFSVYTPTAAAINLTATVGMLDQTVASSFTALSTSGAVSTTYTAVPHIMEGEVFVRVIGNIGDTYQLAAWGDIKTKIAGTSATYLGVTVLPYTQTGSLRIDNPQALDLRLTFGTGPTVWEHRSTIIELVA